MKKVKAFVVNAFTLDGKNGNSAAIVLDGGYSPDEMQKIASKIGFSETTFLSGNGNIMTARYFTPNSEVNLCGHATVAAIGLLSQNGGLPDFFQTKAGKISVYSSNGVSWLSSAKPKAPKEMTLLRDELAKIFNTNALVGAPILADCGLPDFMVEVKDVKSLNQLKPDLNKLSELSAREKAVGAHVYCRDSSATARCRNFAPLYGIDEECATGTSNAALTYVLYKRGLIKADETNVFIQGEAMNMPSKIYTRYDSKNDVVLIGGEFAIKDEISFDLD